jgi:hypothetical protein
MFNLEQAIENWKRQLAAGGAIDSAAIEELESHLRDAVEAKMREGVSADLAFYKSLAELGETETLKGQFRAAEPFRPARARAVKSGAIFLIVGSAIFSANFFSPTTAPKIVGVLVALFLFGAFLAKYLAFVRWKNSDPDLTSFSPAALATLDLARAEAPRLNHDYAGTEHLLLGISGQIPELFQRLGINREGIRQEIEKLVGVGPSRTTAAEIPLTPRAKQALRFAAEEAMRLGHRATRVEHLFLGLLREPGGVASRLLKDLGVEIESARKEVLHQLRGK